MDFDKEHIKRLATLDWRINQLFNDFLAQVAPHLRRIRYGGRGVWSRNPVIERQVDEALKQFAIKYRSLLERHMRAEWELSERKNDSTFMKLIKGAGITVVGSRLLQIFNRQPPGPGADPVDITNVLTLPRRIEADEASMKRR